MLTPQTLLTLQTLKTLETLLTLFDVPREILPDVVASSGVAGESTPDLLGASIPIAGIVGDQQAALFGQLCTHDGMVKNTYGTGCFMLMHTGTVAKPSPSRMLTTVAWRIGGGPLEYALEGSVFIAGAAIQWLRDGLKIIKSAPAINDLAGSVADTGGVMVVPAFAGLGAPYWNPNARGAVLGLTRGSTDAHVALGTLRSLAYRSNEILGCMTTDSGIPIERMRVDGGACASDLLLQIQADLLGARAAPSHFGRPLRRPLGRHPGPARLDARQRAAPRRRRRRRPLQGRAAALPAPAQATARAACADGGLRGGDGGLSVFIPVGPGRVELLRSLPPCRARERHRAGTRAHAGRPRARRRAAVRVLARRAATARDARRAQRQDARAAAVLAAWRQAELAEASRHGAS